MNAKDRKAVQGVLNALATTIDTSDTNIVDMPYVLRNEQDKVSAMQGILACLLDDDLTTMATIGSSVAINHQARLQHLKECSDNANRKARSYVASNELENLLTNGVTSKEVEKASERYRSQGYTRQADMMQHAYQLIQRVIDWRLEGLDTQALLSFRSRFNHSKLFLVSTDERKRDKKIDPEDVQVPIRQGDLDFLYEQAMEGCRMCGKRGDKVIECKHRKAFLSMGLAVCSDNPPEGMCPYFNK